MKVVLDLDLLAPMGCLVTLDPLAQRETQVQLVLLVLLDRLAQLARKARKG